MRRRLVRVLAVGALVLAFAVTGPAAPVSAGAGSGGGALRPGECRFEVNSDGTYTVTIGQGPPNSDGTASRTVTTVQGNVPPHCRLGNLQGMDDIPVDSEDVALAN